MFGMVSNSKEVFSSSGREAQIISQDSCGTQTNSDNTHARSARRQLTFACVVNDSSGCELEDVVKFNFYNISSSFEVLESGQKNLLFSRSVRCEAQAAAH